MNAVDAFRIISQQDAARALFYIVVAVWALAPIL
jgi:hypothetical protein